MEEGWEGALDLGHFSWVGVDGLDGLGEGVCVFVRSAVWFEMVKGVGWVLCVSRR